jgi:hypothetical protein
LRLRAGGSSSRAIGTTSSQVTLGSASSRTTAPVAPLQHQSPTSASTGSLLDQLQLRGGGRNRTPTPAPTPATPAPVAIAPPTGDNTLFHCNITGLGGSTYGQMSMFDVLDKTGGDTLGRYIVAALLNAKAGLAPMLPEATVQNMWNDVLNRGYYEPTAGVQWGPTQIVAYIKQTIA